MNQADTHNGASLNGQVAVIAGGGRGIGRATAIRLAKAGASVMVTARTAQQVEETVNRIRQEGGSAQAFPADVSNWPAMERLAEETERAFGPAFLGWSKPTAPMWLYASAMPACASA